MELTFIKKTVVRNVYNRAKLTKARGRNIFIVKKILKCLLVGVRIDILQVNCKIFSICKSKAADEVIKRTNKLAINTFFAHESKEHLSAFFRILVEDIPYRS